TGVVAERKIVLPETHIRDDLKSEIAAGLGHGKSTAAWSDSVVGIIRQPKMHSRICRDPTHPTLISDSIGENFSFAKIVEDSRIFGAREERIAKLQPKIDPLLDCFATLAKMGDASERLFETRHSSPVGRAAGGPCP